MELRFLMASVLNRTTRQYLTSVNTPDYPVVDWIIEPDVSAVAGQPGKYWKIVGDVVSLMSAGEQATVDAAEQTARRDAIAAELDQVEDVLRALTLTILDEINLHATRSTAILNAADGAANYGAFRTAIAAIADVPTRTITQLKTVLRSKLGS